MININTFFVCNFLCFLPLPLPPPTSQLGIKGTADWEILINISCSLRCFIILQANTGLWNHHVCVNIRKYPNHVWTNWRIFMKFGVNIMSLEVTLLSYFKFRTTDNIDMGKYTFNIRLKICGDKSPRNKQFQLFFLAWITRQPRDFCFITLTNELLKL